LTRQVWREAHIHNDETLIQITSPPHNLLEWED